MNKPNGAITTVSDMYDRKTVMHLLPPNYLNAHLFPIGRLDKTTTGLILLTNDGSTANKILKTSYNNEKEYLVRVNRPISEDILKKMSEGVAIVGKKTKKCKVEKLKSTEFKIILTQGLNRQIRRMCEYFDFRVVSLRRVRIMNIKLDVKEGKYRLLNDKEISELTNMLKK